MGNTTMNEGKSHQPLILVGMVCYYGKHYSTFFFHNKLNMWIYFDDAQVIEVGKRWANVVDKCVKSRHQPLLLLYTNPDAEPMKTATAPKNVTLLPEYQHHSVTFSEEPNEEYDEDYDSYEYDFKIPPPISKDFKIPPPVPKHQPSNHNTANDHVTNNHVEDFCVNVEPSTSSSSSSKSSRHHKVKDSPSKDRHLIDIHSKSPRVSNRSTPTKVKGVKITSGISTKITSRRRHVQMIVTSLMPVMTSQGS